jgi:hypothetical protein
MPLTAESVAAASNAWVWIPDNATVLEDAQYKLARLPDYFDHQLRRAGFVAYGREPVYDIPL